MSDNHDALMAELEQIINGSMESVKADRESEMRKFIAVVADSTEVANDLDGDGVYLYAIVPNSRENAEAAGAVDLDGKTPTTEQLDAGDYQAIKIEKVHHFANAEEANDMMTDPTTQLAYEGTMPDTGNVLIYIGNGERVEALLYRASLVVRKHIGTETVTYYTEPDGIDPDDFFSTTSLTQVARSLVQNLVSFRGTPSTLRQQYPRLFAKMYEEWKQRMREADGGE